MKTSAINENLNLPNTHAYKLLYLGLSEQQSVQPSFRFHTLCLSDCFLCFIFFCYFFAQSRQTDHKCPLVFRIKINR
jgi:hypothetical protein